MLAREICQDCEKVFMGGPKAFLCPDCRKRRQSENAKRNNLARKRMKGVRNMSEN